MRKLQLLSPLLPSTDLTIPTTLSSIPFPLPFITTSATANPTSGDGDDDDDDVGPSPRIIHRKDLLRRSRTRPSDQPGGLHVLDLIDDGSLEPCLGLYSDLVKMCTSSRKLEEARIVHAHLTSSRFETDVFFQNSMVNMYAKCGGMEDARRMFDEMPLRDVVTWTTLISGYAQHDMPEKALELLPGMLGAGLVPNQFTFASLLKAGGACSSDEVGKQIHALCAKCGYDLDVYVGSALLDMYARHGKMDEACLTFDGLNSKNEVSWNALIAGFERKGQPDIALRKFWEMQRGGIMPTHYTYSSVFGACASTGALEQGRWIHAHMVKTGHGMTTFVANTLLDMYAKSGSIEDARKVFDRLDKKDEVSWNAMLKGCAQHGLGKEVMQRFKDMLKYGIKPNDITFLCILTACSHGGLLTEGRYHFELMKKYNVEPNIEHYVTMVDLLGRAGLLNQAERFIKEVPIQPTAAIWGALLGSCRMHKNDELGRYAAERIFELDPCDSGPRILLSNIYASVGKWGEAAKVRKLMKESGVKKELACSWVEIGNSIHTFVANDKFHPQIKETVNMWEEINKKIKDAGYVPDTSCVLLFVEEQERETQLQYHSEKLALAFAILNAPSLAPIHIKKNIRMCGDCHSAFKFASKVMEREIVVRDTKRFHHFGYGACSCGDYW